MRFRSWSYRFAEEVLNGKMPIKKEIEEVIYSINFEDVVSSSRKGASKSGKIPIRTALNKFFEEEFLKRGWKGGHGGVAVFDEKLAPKTKVDFLKDRIAIEVAFVHSDFLGNDLLKFQMMSYSHLNKIDVGVYIVATKELIQNPRVNFEGSIDFEKVRKYLPEYRSSIQVPIFVIGLEP
ncbi:MAG: BglII/BstYI family type II restriction endonuclease [Methanobacteriota archaeon]